MCVCDTWQRLIVWVSRSRFRLLPGWVALGAFSLTRFDCFRGCTFSWATNCESGVHTQLRRAALRFLHSPLLCSPGLSFCIDNKYNNDFLSIAKFAITRMRLPAANQQLHLAMRKKKMLLIESYRERMMLIGPKKQQTLKFEEEATDGRIRSTECDLIWSLALHVPMTLDSMTLDCDSLPR